MKVSLVIPAYNESEGVSQSAEKLRPVWEELQKSHTLEVVFVNDGSKDNTLTLLQETFKGDNRVKIVSHEVNRGLGAAIRTGLENATGAVIITTDFDGTYEFNTIPQLLDKFLEDNSDIVTASPYHPQGKVEGVPRYRLLFSQGASIGYRLLVNRKIHTWTALFRAYRRTVIESVSFESNDFLAGTELLVNALRSGYKVSEFPTVLSTRSFGQSSLKVARVTKTHLTFLLRILWWRLSGKFSLKRK